MIISQNYAGKKIDLCVLGTSSNPGTEVVKVGLLDSGSVIAGPYKVVQKFIKYLLTEVGSVVADPTYGTEFIQLLMSGQIHTNSELILRFNLEYPAAKNYIRRSNLTPTDDENLIAVTLESFEAIQDTATMRLLFTFKDNSTLLTPVSISTL